MDNVNLESFPFVLDEGEQSVAINANVDCIYFTNINTQANVLELVECLPMVYSRVVFTEPICDYPVSSDVSASMRLAIFLNGVSRCVRTKCRVDVSILATFSELMEESKKENAEDGETVSQFSFPYGGLRIRVFIAYASDFVDGDEDINNMTVVIRHADAFRFEIVKKGEPDNGK